VSALANEDRPDAAPDLGPWMWGVNGACGVVASGLALTCSMVWGISTTLGVGAVCYALLALCTARMWATGYRQPELLAPSEVETEAVSVVPPADAEGPKS
jgi:hypothetical protein